MPPMLDSSDTVQADLHGGRAPWGRGFRPPGKPPLSQSMKTDVLVVGGGITGSLAAQHLAAHGVDVTVVDREQPGLGSTAASTAMLQWEIDCTLGELTGFYGFDRAAQLYRRSVAAVQGLAGLVGGLGFDCSFRPRSTLYISAAEAGPSVLRDEYVLRERAGLPGLLLDHKDLLSRFGIDRAAAILSPGSADADPLLLSWGLLRDAQGRGARLVDAMVTAYHDAPGAVTVETDGPFVIEARHVVLATGYVMPDFVRSEIHRTASSWAIATVPQAAGTLWPGGELIWEASQTYNYARTTVDGRIIIGGGDDNTVDPVARDKKMTEKSEKLASDLVKLWPAANPAIDFSWSGAFGETDDGLPLIGAVPGMPRILAAYGYGGNGITFSFTASRILAELCAGRREGWFDAFAIDRPSPAG
ncbi:FAD-dependent oxidoreductase [Rhizobium sp. LjRoot98]|uniref:NAD(P)/FAD-dependent oxidoreductase n=1 Tax=unclassified Rhizobium TaxID=2613769 RepID=UPI0007134B9A|nr:MULTISPECIES: FAD-dependent oxidoreductase [unclassified Rhizobium]KQV34054.1 N-acetylglucosamine-1-phosphate uridyltransferase [Rhizobium sp. Root1204]KQY17649.1 N-acetylglucosamine-1-phosphate uridyltransferase [Rhizobium sp. Root1334]KRC13521.1 N-acetylglucosamine-1-phosphate uridyltransferase [Rhizobium sp. Root73]